MRIQMLACAFSVGIAGVAMAQQPAPPGKAAAERGPGGQAAQPAQRAAAAPPQAEQGSGWQEKDRTIAACVALDNQTEIAISKFAEEKLQHEKAKEFAGMMVKDHQAFLTKLQKFAPNAGQEDISADAAGEQAAAPDSKVPGKPEAGRSTAGFRGDPNGGLDMMQIHREMAQQCLNSAKKGLSDKKESEVDACFIGWQIATHGMMQDKLTVLERHASGELAKVLAEGRDTAQKHMQAAEKIMEELTAHSGSSKAERQEEKAERQEKRRDK